MISDPRTVLEQLLNLIPPPWGQIAAATVIANKAWIRSNIGAEGTDLHLNWLGTIHWVGRRGDPSNCLQATALQTPQASNLSQGAPGSGPATSGRFELRPLTVRVEQSQGISDLPITVNVQGDIFQDVHGEYLDSAEKGGLVFDIRNRSGDWIAVDVIRRDGVDKTHHRIPNGADDSIVQNITQFQDASFQYRIIRWRPGVFGLPGSGGGQIVFNVPESAGSGRLEFTVVR